MKNKIEWYDILQKLVDLSSMPYRTLIYGPPGTGKSSWPVELFGEEVCERVTLCAGSAKEDLLGQFLLISGETVWRDGPAVRAIRHGRCLILDELGEHSPEVETLLQGLLNDRRILSVTLPNGEKIIADGNYRVIGTTNTNPQESLGAALFDRFELKLFAGVPVPGIIDLLPQELQHAVVNHYMRFKPSITKVDVSARSAMAYKALAVVFGDEQAMEIVFGTEGAIELQSVIASMPVKA